MRTFFRILPLFMVSVALLAPQAVSARGDTPEIRKVKYFHVNLTQSFDTADPMMSFERRYFLYGAVTSEEYQDRAGKYYSVFWWANGDKRPGMVVRLEYLQSGSGDEVKVKEVTVENVRRMNTTDINVIGEDFSEDGNIVAWRASLVRDGEVISTVESFLWE